MTSPADLLVDAYRPWLAQVFQVELPPLETAIEQTVGEALVLPDPAALARGALPREDTAPARAETTAWLRRMLRPEWQDQRDDLGLVGMRSAVRGQDALFGGWFAPGAFLQTIATAEHVHLRGRLSAPRPSAPDPDKAALVIAEAHRLLSLADPASIRWAAPRRLGPLVFVARDVSFAHGWGDTGLLVTDGVGFKLSFLKLRDRTSPPKGGGPHPIEPWFPRPSPE